MQAPTQSAHPHMNGRDKVPWSDEVWKRLDAAAHEELTRVRIGAKFLPTFRVPAKTLTLPSDSVLIGGTTSVATSVGFVTALSPSLSAGTANALSVDEGG